MFTKHIFHFPPKISPKILGGFIYYRYICNALHFKSGRMLSLSMSVRHFFYALTCRKTIRTYRLPYPRVVRQCAHCLIWCNATGQVEAVFNFTTLYYAYTKSIKPPREQK